MHNAYITSTIYALRGKGSVSFCFNDYCNSRYSLSDRFERDPIQSSISQRCSCCGAGFSTHKLTINACYLYGQRQSSLLHRSAYRKLVLANGDRFSCCYYKCSPSYGLERACCANERVVCCNGKRRNRLSCCCVVGESSGHVNDTEVLLSLLNERVNEDENRDEDRVYCVGGGKRRNWGSYRRVEAKGKEDLRVRERNFSAYERVQARKRVSGGRFCEDCGKKKGEVGLGDVHRDRREASLRDENRRLRREGSSCSSLYYSVSSSGDLDFDDESQVHDKHTLLAEENLSGYKDSKLKEGRFEGQMKEKYEGYVDKLDDESEQRTRVMGGVTWDQKNKMENHSEILVDDVQESGRESSQRHTRVSGIHGSSRERISSSHEKFDKKDTWISGSEVNLDTRIRKQYAQSENRVGESSSTSRGKFAESTGVQESLRDDMKISSQSRVRLGSSEESVDIGKDERRKAVSYNVEEENINRNSQIKRISEVQDFDTQRTSLSQSRSDVEVASEEEYRKNVSTSQQGREQANARKNSGQAIKISEVHDTNIEKTSITQSQTNISNQVNNTNLISISYGGALQPLPQLQTDQRAPRRAQSGRESYVVNETERVIDSRRTSENRVQRESETILAGTSVDKAREGNDRANEKLRQSKPGQELGEASISQERLRLDYQARIQNDDTEELVRRSSQTTVTPPRSQSLTRSSLRDDLEVGFEKQNISINTSEGGSSSQEHLRLDYQARIQNDGTEELVRRSSRTTVTPPRSQSLTRSSLRDDLEIGFEKQNISITTSEGGSSSSYSGSRRQNLSLQEDSYESSERAETEPLYLTAPEDALGSADRFQQSTSQFIGEFVEKARHEASTSEISRVDEVSETKLTSDDVNSSLQIGSGDNGHSSGGLGTKGPSDEMWVATDPSAFKTPKSEEPEKSEPIPTVENAVVKRSGRSLWNIISDIITLKWSGHSETPHLRSGRRNSPNESAASEGWFSTHESELSRDKPTSKISHLQSDKGSDRLQLTGNDFDGSTRGPGAEPSPSTTRMGSGSTSKRMGSGSTSKRISFSADENLGWNEGGKSSRASPSGIEITESPSRQIVSQISDTTSPGTDSVEPILGSEVLVGEGSGSGELKRRKLQRIKQVPKDRFDEWEEAFTLESEQRKLDEMFMREALVEARKAADTWEVPVGAVLVHNGTIIARGYNLVEELRDSTAHAEMICIREASNHLRSWRLADTTLYVTLEPCPMCAGAILQARVSNLVWGAPNKLLGADGSWIRLFPDGNPEASDKPAAPIHPFHPKMNIRRGVLGSECAEVMQQFFQLRRKKKEKQAGTEVIPSSRFPSSHPTKLLKKMHDVFHIMFCL